MIVFNITSGLNQYVLTIFWSNQDATHSIQHIFMITADNRATNVYSVTHIHFATFCSIYTVFQKKRANFGGL